MRWTTVALMVVAVAVLSCVMAKLYLRRRLQDIDGLGAVRQPKQESESDIADFGDDT